MEMIDSLQNARVKKWARLHQKKGRDETGLFLIEGEHLIQEALKAGIVETILFDKTAPFHFDSLIQVTPQIMAKLSMNPSGAHWIAVCRQFHNVCENPKRILILDGVQDPGNFGTLIRTAVSFSFDAIYTSLDSCDLYNEKVIRSTQGALFMIPVVRTDLVEQVKKLQENEFKVVATTLEKAKPMLEIQHSEKMAFILGNEGQGVSRQLQDLADERLRIEMSGFESLNVAIAGGIVMYQFRG